MTSYRSNPIQRGHSRRNLTAVLSLVGLLTAGSVFLFGHLLFKTLSKDVVDEAILSTGATTMQQMGQVMGAIMGTAKGQVDGSIVQAKVKAKLG